MNVADVERNLVLDRLIYWTAEGTLPEPTTESVSILVKKSCVVCRRTELAAFRLCAVITNNLSKAYVTRDSIDAATWEIVQRAIK